MTIPKKEERRHYFAALLEEALADYGEALDELAVCREQYEGSKKIDGSEEEATATRNITYELIESQISADIPSPKVDSFVFTREKSRRATSIERLCHQTRLRLPLEEFNSRDERMTYIYGGSIWQVEWDETAGARKEGGIKLTCISPEQFIPQPGMTEIEDMDYCFLYLRTTREELCRRFGVSEEDSLRASVDVQEGAGASAASGRDAVTLAVCYYKNERGEVARFIWSGELTLADDEAFYRRRRLRCRTCGQSAVLCRCREKADLIEENLFAESALPFARGSAGKRRRGTAKMAELFGEIPYYAPERFPLILRRNTTAERRLLGGSDCLIIRSQQQQINKIESRIHQKLMRAGITPMMPEDARITLNNSVFGQVLKLREGERAEDYGTLDTTPSIAQDVTQAERLYRQAKRIIGITDTFQGESDVYAQSGVAKQLQIAQAAGRLESKRRMKQAAYAKLDRMIFEFHLAFADGARELSFRDALGRSGRDVFNRYDFLIYDGAHGGFYYDTDYLFSCEKSESPELARDMLWQKNLENLRAGTLGDPLSPVTLLRYWRSQEQAHYPFARENVEYFEELARSEEKKMSTLVDDILLHAQGADGENRVTAKEEGVNALDR